MNQDMPAKIGTQPNDTFSEGRANENAPMSNAAFKSASASAKSKPHVCRFCSRAFARQEHLRRHELSHTKEKPFECSQCARPFARRDLVIRHQQHLHTLETTSMLMGPGTKRQKDTSSTAAEGAGQVSVRPEESSSVREIEMRDLGQLLKPRSKGAIKSGGNNNTLAVVHTSSGNYHHQNRRVDRGLDASTAERQAEAFSLHDYRTTKDDVPFDSKSAEDAIPLLLPPSPKGWDLASPYPEVLPDIPIDHDMMMLDCMSSNWTLDFEKQLLSDMAPMQIEPSCPTSISSQASTGIATPSDIASPRPQEQHDTPGAQCPNIPAPQAPVPAETAAPPSASVTLDDNKYPAILKIVHGTDTHTALLRLRKNTISSIERQAKEYLEGKVVRDITAARAWRSHLVSVAMDGMEIDVSCYEDDDLTFLLELLSRNTVSQFTVSVFT